MEILLIIFLTFFSFLVWRHLPTLQFQGEGFYYFTNLPETISYASVSEPIKTFSVHYDAFAISLFNLIGPIFKDQVHLYMWLMFIVMILTDIVFFILVKITTGSRFAAVVAFILFSLSFVGKYDMYSSGGYQYFVQRGVLLLPLFTSFIFLHKYITLRKLRYFFISLSVYLISIIMGYFGTWFLAPFIFYPFFYVLVFSRKSLNKIMKVIWLPIPYLVGNFLIVKESSYAFTEDSIFELLYLKTELVVSGIIHQLSVITLPAQWYKLVAEILPRFGSSINTTYILALILIILYGGGLIVIKKLYPNWIGLSLTALSSLLSMLFFNLYLNASATFNTVGSSRYFYFPSSMVALFWGLVTVAFLKKSKLKPRIIVFFLILFWIFNNVSAIRGRVKSDYQKNKNNYDTIIFLRNWSTQLKERPSYLILPSNMGAYGGEFAELFYINPKGYVGVEGLHQLDYQELAEKKVDPERLFVLHYGYGENLDLVIDETDKWRKYLKDLQANTE